MKEKMFNTKNIYFICTLFIAVMVGFYGGIVDILHTPTVVNVAEALGYPLYFFTLLGVFKILGAIALFLPKKFDRIREIAYIGFAVDFIFASFSHYSINDDISKIVTPLIMLAILAVSYFLKDRSY